MTICDRRGLVVHARWYGFPCRSNERNTAHLIVDDEPCDVLLSRCSLPCRRDRCTIASRRNASQEIVPPLAGARMFPQATAVSAYRPWPRGSRRSYRGPVARRPVSRRGRTAAPVTKAWASLCRTSLRPMAVRHDRSRRGPSRDRDAIVITGCGASGSSRSPCRSLRLLRPDLSAGGSIAPHLRPWLDLGMSERQIVLYFTVKASDVLAAILRLGLSLAWRAAEAADLTQINVLPPGERNLSQALRLGHPGGTPWLVYCSATRR
jgi:hypothetical protein